MAATMRWVRKVLTDQFMRVFWLKTMSNATVFQRVSSHMPSVTNAMIVIVSFRMKASRTIPVTLLVWPLQQVEHRVLLVTTHMEVLSIRL